MQIGCEANTLSSCWCEMPFLATKRSRLAQSGEGVRAGQRPREDEEQKERQREGRGDAHVQALWRALVHAAVLEHA